MKCMHSSRLDCIGAFIVCAASVLCVASTVQMASAQVIQSTPAGTTQDLFTPAVNPILFRLAGLYPSGDFEASSVALADVNHDGILDMIVANGCGSGVGCSMQGSVAVLLG